MIAAFLKIAELLGKFVGAIGDRADEASLASRHALTLAQNYVGDLANNLPRD